MNTITIPRNLIKNDDLVIIPRTEYSNLLELKKVIPIVNATKKKSLLLGVVKKKSKEVSI